ARGGLRIASLIRGKRAPKDHAMAAADLPGTDEERAEAALIAAAGNILRRDNREVPEDFVAALFAYAVPEDLMRYDPRQLAELAANAWSLLAVRKPGVPKIRPEAFDPAGHERLRNDSVLEIVNDDMPFLVDSVLAELAERGIEVRFVVHPVLSVERDAAGRLTAFKGAKPAAGALRESVIYIHIERIEEEARRAEIVEAIERALADVRLCVQDWRAMNARLAGPGSARPTPTPPLPAAGDVPGHRVPGMARGQQFHLPRHPRLHIHGRRGRARARVRNRTRHFALARHAGTATLESAPRHHAADARAAQAADAAHRHQGRGALARAPA